MTTLLKDQPVVMEAYGKYKQFNQDERLRALDEAHQRFLNDQASDLAEARKERDIEIARNMKQLGSNCDFIAQVTGLPRAEIERL